MHERTPYGPALHPLTDVSEPDAYVTEGETKERQKCSLTPIIVYGNGV